jgi:hypothetical protein
MWRLQLGGPSRSRATALCPTAYRHHASWWPPPSSRAAA